MRFDDQASMIKAFATETRMKPAWIRCDNGSDINIGALEELCRGWGTALELTPTYSPEQDGVSEVGFKTIFTKARSAMIDMRIPQEY